MSKMIIEVVNPQKKTIAMLMVKQFKEVIDTHNFESIEFKNGKYVTTSKIIERKQSVIDIDGKRYINYENLNDVLRVHLNNRFKDTDKLKGCTVRLLNEFVGL